jgi:hypothetical protein
MLKKLAAGGILLAAVPITLFALLAAVILVVIAGSSGIDCGPGSDSAVESSQVAVAGDEILVSGKPLSNEQTQIAQEIIGQGKKRGLSDRDITIAIATGYQESKLRNLNYGHSDSLGVFQQRPSVKAWGTATQIRNVPHAVGKFYDALEAVKNRDQMTMQQVAEAVQRPRKGIYSDKRNRFRDWLPMAGKLLGGVVKGVAIQQITSTDPSCNAQEFLGEGGGGKFFGSIGECAGGTKAGVGNIPGGEQIQLCSIDGIVVEAGISARAAAMIGEARAAGLAISGSGYRPSTRQIELRRQNCGSSQYAIYEMPSSRCRPPTAPPGKSNHEVGHAIDFTTNGRTTRRGDSVHAWLSRHAKRFGFYNLPSESWHWSVDGR